MVYYDKFYFVVTIINYYYFSDQLINILQVTLHQKDLEIQELEEKHKKFVDKAKSVVKSMDTKNVGLSDVDTSVLQNRLLKANKEITDLKVSTILCNYMW